MDFFRSHLFLTFSVVHTEKPQKVRIRFYLHKGAFIINDFLKNLHFSALFLVFKDTGPCFDKCILTLLGNYKKKRNFKNDLAPFVLLLKTFT